MRYLLDNILIVVGVTIGLILFLMGLRRALKVREPRTAADKILIAASITILSLTSSGCGEDGRSGLSRPTCYEAPIRKPVVENFNQEVTELSEPEQIIEDTIYSKEFKDLYNQMAIIRKIYSDKVKKYGELHKLLAEEKDQDKAKNIRLRINVVSQWHSSISQWFKKLSDELDGYIKEREKIRQDENAPFLTQKQLINEIKFQALEYSKMLPSLGREMMCYVRVPEPEEPRILRSEKEYKLRSLWKSGKITEETYKKAVLAIGVLPGLSQRNSILLGDLIEIYNGQKKIDMTRISKNLAKRIDNLIGNLNGSDSEQKNACAELKMLGKVVIPRLKNAVQKNSELTDITDNILREFANGTD